MCLAKISLKNINGDKIVSENVTSVEVMEHKVIVTTLFNEQKEIDGNIKKVDFVNGHVILESLN